MITVEQLPLGLKRGGEGAYQTCKETVLVEMAVLGGAVTLGRGTQPAQDHPTERKPGNEIPKPTPPHTLPLSDLLLMQSIEEPLGQREGELEGQMTDNQQSQGSWVIVTTWPLSLRNRGVSRCKPRI